MANSTTTLDLLSASQANKEITANSLFDAASPAMLYGRRASTSAALTFGYYGGTVSIAGTPTQIANGTVTLAASATNYIEADPATGAVSVNQTGFTSGRMALYSVVTGAATVTSYTDLRVLGGGGGSGTVKSVNTKTPDGSGAVTLTASDVGADASGAAASAVSAHVAASDPHTQYLTQTEGDARYSAAGSGGTVTSVSLSAPSALLSVSGSPVTGSGTLALSLASQAVNTVFAGPSSGGSAVPTFRSLTAADLPVMVGSGSSHAAGIVPDPGSTAGTTRYLREDGTWAAPSGTATGTVTSVDLSVPGLLYTVSGNPVTTSGTLTFTLKTQTANTFLAGPTSGAAATPTMRTLVAADMAALLAAVNVFTKNQCVAPVALIDGATISVDASLSNNFSVTLGGNRALANPTNLTAGMVLNFAIDQDATGSRTLAFGSLYKFAGSNTLSSTASAKDLISCYYDGTILRCSLNKGFA